MRSPDAKEARRVAACCSASDTRKRFEKSTKLSGIRIGNHGRAVLLLSRPEEFHLRALPEPCMTLSSHTAPDVRPLPERLCLVHRLLLFPVGQWPRPNNAAPSLQPHYRAFDATTGCSAPPPRFGTLALAVGGACGLPLHVLGRAEAQVLPFHPKAWSSFAPPTCRMPLGQYQGIPRADPGGRVTPRF